MAAWVGAFNEIIQENHMGNILSDCLWGNKF